MVSEKFRATIKLCSVPAYRIAQQAQLNPTTLSKLMCGIERVKPEDPRVLKVAAVIGLGLNSAAYQAEYFRGAVQSIESGQMTAARSIGMSRFKAIRSVILPQALRIVIPSWSNELIYSIKYSSLAYFLSLTELTFVGKKTALHSARTFETYIIVAAIYLVIVVGVSRLLLALENRVRVPGLGVSHGHR